MTNKSSLTLIKGNNKCYDCASICLISSTMGWCLEKRKEVLTLFDNCSNFKLDKERRKVNV